ncbi:MULTISPECIES: ExbD/TolR family protein [Thalassospira]|jgi:biopolymer transport protein ExbD|uniref:Biopolymer transport protein ExbD n=2 Tax=Thalassospira TaxID=168934 RepID=A0ABX0X4T5_9PROT|nr:MULTISPECIES: biopolymer transporter ExbD [Thalassospira]KXJ59276.1 MAG: biopolymer transporter ExbD [Thalassospira sp. Nap_22]AXO15287.1 biopolymer transporter ExbD [Thalassospira indica]EKF06298.1 biopolymertransporter ExbD/TolR [Thalassospira profundimaris WP0211]KZC99630.1 biopolymer transporter ExbD [Thalassospira sp. MCCC 1A02898]MBC05459.1 biopolymer transporter ExbD [Thalassospira sp.]|tara:strand:- start:81 stop:488 length:408 start_codon:yes stop_codon:yes gene_type:complete
MKRRIQIAEDGPVQEPMLPLINIVFLLLIFFMIAGSLQKLGPFEVDPPASQTAEGQPEDTIVLWFGSNGEIGIDDLTGGLDRLSSMLPADYIGRPVEIRADREVEGAKVVTLLARLQELGIEKVQLMTAMQPGQE